MKKTNLKKETKILWCLYRKRPDSLFIPIDRNGLYKIVTYAFKLGLKEQMELIETSDLISELERRGCLKEE